MATAASTQAPMIWSPLKQTNEIDWISPLKAYIRGHYGDDPERYSEECSTLNRLRQDMRGAAKDSAAGRDLLYRYYGQLELLDLRFPVDENHIKLSFTWFDAFTQRPTAQHSLAYEKASIIFNIAAVLSCHAVHQNRHEDTGLKTAYHSFQASAGMFQYINDNFLHAPSTDLSNETVRTLIQLMLAQAQEVFLEKQIADGKKVGLLAKLASQAAGLYAQAVEGVQENVNKAVFEKVWLLLAQVKAGHMASVAQYYQALADNETSSHGAAIARLQSAERQCKEIGKTAATFPASPPASSNLPSDSASTLVSISKRHLTTIQEKIIECIKDNDFIYHQAVPSEAALAAVPKLPAAKAITVSELYQGQDIQRIIGPDIFQKIVPMSVTESASLYDEEKAKLIRAETERSETANSEMAASLDYLKLPGSLNVIKNGVDQEMTVDQEFRDWCHDLAGHVPFGQAFDKLGQDKTQIMNSLDRCNRQLDMEESVCEKMRSKHGVDWTQQPSSRLTVTLKGDIRNYRAAIEEASTSDTQLQTTFRQNEADFDEMRSAGEADEADVLYQRAMIKAGAARSKSNTSGLMDAGGMDGDLLGESFDEEGSASVAEQIANIEELMRKLSLIKRERAQVLKDLKEKIHNDDISQVLILNKKSITNQEHQLFKAELEKFRPHQNRLLQANHKQQSVMKELTRAYSDLLQDKRVRAEQNKYESFSRQRNTVLSKYRKVAHSYKDLTSGLDRAQAFYSEMKNTTESLSQNVESFVSNRKAEGGELLAQIERRKANGSTEQADRERDRMQELMNRMTMDVRASPQIPTHTSQGQRPPPLQHTPSFPNAYNPATSTPLHPTYSNTRPPQPMSSPSYIPQQAQQYPQNGSIPQGNPYPQAPQRGPAVQSPYYNPTNYGPTSPPTSPPAQKQYLPNMQSQYPGYGLPSPQHQPKPSGHYTPQGFVPPPPNGPPPQSAYGVNGPGGYYAGPQQGQPTTSPPQQPRAPAPSQPGDPWSGLNNWR